MNPEQILGQMTLEQKVEFLSGEGDWHTKALTCPDIPAISMADGPNGLRIEMDSVTRDSFPATCYPAMAALASAWDRELAEKLAEDLAEECHAASLDLLLGPGVNLKRSPLCGRNFEYLSEDPYLASELAYAYVTALQKKGVGASLKHFAVNNQEYCRMTVNARVGERALRELYLKCFEKTVREAKPDTVMSSYNLLNGVQMAHNPILDEVLRKEWGFEGTVVSDWGSVSQRDESVRVGMDLEMPASQGYFDEDVYEALREGRLCEEQIDACVLRILKLVEKRLNSRTEPVAFDAEAHHALAREIACRAMVLLKNEEELLPLSIQKKTAVIGEFAQTPRYQGGGSAHVKPARLEIPLEELAKEFSSVSYEAGYRIDGQEDDSLLESAVDAAREADVAVIFAGLPDQCEEECYDRVNLELPEVQNRLIERVTEINPNTVVVLFAGSAVTMPWADRVKSILMTYLPGEAAGSAITSVLSGKAEPTGRLAETFPVRLEDTPSFGNFPGDGYNVDYAEGIYAGYRWYDKRKIEPAFAFGSGMGYTAFSYGSLRADRTQMDGETPVELTLTVRNSGNRKGREVVQLYVSQESGRWGYVRQLKGFETVELEPGEEREISFRIAASDLAVWSERAGRFLVQDDIYCFEAAHDSRDIRDSVSVRVCTGQYEPARVERNVNVGQLLADPDYREIGQRMHDGMIADRIAQNPSFDPEKAIRMGQSLFLTYPARNFIDLCTIPGGRKLEAELYAYAEQKKAEKDG